MREETNKKSEEASQHGHEPDALDSRWLKLSIAGLILLVVCALLIVYGARSFLAREVSTENPPTSVIQRTQTVKGPQVTADQPQQLRALRRAEQHRLESYEWIDESAGIARIPIDRAMQILAKQGLPAIEPDSEEQHGSTLK